MATITRSALRSTIRQRADMEDSQFISDSELNGYIQSSAAELYDLLVESNEDYNTLDKLVTISSGNSFSLPQNCYKVRGLDYTTDGGATFIPVWPFNFLERGAQFDPTLSRRIAQVRYKIMAGKIILLPESEAPGQYRLWWVPTLDPLVTDQAKLEGYNGFEEYVVLDCTIKCLNKEESDVSAHERALTKMKKRIENMSKSRDQGGPEVVADVRDPWRDLW